MQNCSIWQIGRNVEVYVDDIVIKSDEGSRLLADLTETFQSLRAYNIKLNLKKCVFGVPAGKLLGFMVSERGIEANPEKIAEIQNMKPPQQLRDVQKLTGCLAALSRFISRLGEKALPLDEGVTPRLLRVRIPGAYEDRRPARSFDGPTTGPL